MGVSAADTDPSVYQPPPPEDDPAPVGGSTGADGGGEDTAPVSAPASSPEPAAPVDTFEGPPAPAQTKSTPAPAPEPKADDPKKSDDPKPTGGFYGAAGADVERRLNDNTKQLQGVLKDSGDPSKFFFGVTTTAHERAGLLGKVEEKSTGVVKDSISRERRSFDDMARANFSEFKRSEKRQEELQALPPDQQKAFRAALDQYDAKNAPAPVTSNDPAARRKAELQRTLSDSYTQLPNLAQQALAKPEKALDYAHAWNKADDARRELNEPANRSWFEDKRKVVDGALSRNGLGDGVRQQLWDEREKTDAAESKDRVKQYDQDIADMKAGRKPDDGGHAERMRAWNQDRVDRVEGKGPPTAAYQTEKKQLDAQKADLDKQIAEEKAKSKPAPAPAQGTAGAGGQPAAGGQDAGRNFTLERLQRERADLDKKGDQVERKHREALDDYAKDQAERASRQPQRALDGLQQQRADLDKQLADKSLDPGKRAELEKQRAGLDGQVDKARAEVKRAEQEATDKVRALAEKEGGSKGLWDQANKVRDQLGDYDRNNGVPAKRDELARAKENQGYTERGLEQAKKDQKAISRGELRLTRDGKDVPNKEFGRETDERVNTLEKGLAGDRARTGRAEADLAATQVGRKELEAQQAVKIAQATAADIGTQRLGQRPESLGRSGFPSDIERGLLSKDPQVQKDAAAKATAWIDDRKRNGLGPTEKAELKELGKKYGFEPHEDRGLYRAAKNAESADQGVEKARGEAKRTAEEADRLEKEAKERGAQLPPKPTEVPPDRNRFPAQPQPQPAAPQPAQGGPAKTPPTPEKERAPIDPALSPEDRAHLERQQKEVLEMGEKVRAKVEPFAKWLQSQGVPTPPSTRSGGGTGADPSKVVPDGVKDAAHDALKSALENPAVVKKLMENERFAYGFMSQAAGMVGGLYELGEMGVKGVANVVSDPQGAAEKAWNGIKYAAENPGQVAKDTWDGAVKIATGLKDAVVKSYEKDPEEFKGRAAFEVLSFLIPGAGEAGAAAKGANATSKAAEVLRAGEAGAELLRAGEKGAEVLSAAEKATEVAKGVEKGAEVAKATEKAVEVAKAGEGTAEALRPGTQAFDELKKTVEAKEELARRLRESLPGGRHEPIDGMKGRSHGMSGRGSDMTPEMAQRQVAKLEKEAAEGRATLDAAAKAGRSSVEEIGKVAEKEAGKLTAEQFTEKVMGYPKELTEKFTNGEIESARVYLGNEVKGNPLDPAKRFPQSDLIEGLDEAKKGFIGADGKAVPPGEVGRINFKHINGQLRGIKKDLTPGEIDRVNEVVKRMDTMMEKSTVQEPTTVYRVTGKGSYSTPDAKGFLPPDKGFQSTGRTPQLGFAGQKEEAAKSILQIIEVPKGTKALDMDALTRFYGDLESFRGRMPHGVPGSSPFGENELLLARGTQLQVVDQWVDPATGLTIQRARVVPAKK